MKQLKYGEKVLVRMRDGSVKEATYNEQTPHVDRHHWVLIDGLLRIAGSFERTFTGCRFIGPACGLVVKP